MEHFEYPGYEGRFRGPFRDIVVNNTVEAELSGTGAKLAEWEGISIDDPAKLGAQGRRGRLVGDVL